MTCICLLHDQYDTHPYLSVNIINTKHSYNCTCNTITVLLIAVTINVNVKQHTVYCIRVAYILG